MRLILVCLLGLSLAACGNRAMLQPAREAELPVAPYGAAKQPNADELLEIPAQAAPARNVELRKRSERREDDPFDFPPEG